MTIKIISLLAAVAAFSSFSAPAFASEEDELLNPDSSAVESEVAPPPIRCQPWMRNCRRPQPLPQNIVCYARNITGRTFAAYGNWRSSQYLLQQRAVQSCRYGSNGIIGRTCRSIGCRSEGGRR